VKRDLKREEKRDICRPRPTKGKVAKKDQRKDAPVGGGGVGQGEMGPIIPLGSLFGRSRRGKGSEKVPLSLEKKELGRQRGSP